MMRPRPDVASSIIPICRHRAWDQEQRCWRFFWVEFNTFKKCRKCGIIVITRHEEFHIPGDTLDGNIDRVIRDQPGLRSWWSKRLTRPHRPMRGKDRLKHVSDLEAEWRRVADRIGPEDRGKVFVDFYERYTMQQIAEVVKLSRERVRQLIKKANSQE